MSEPSAAAYEAARAKYDGIVISRGGYGYRPGHHEAILAAVDVVWPLAYDAGVAEGQRQAAADIERPDSGLCDCPREEGTPTNPETGVEMDHHCDCAAVVAAATMLRSYSATQHGRQCIHGTTMDEFYAEGADR